MGVGGISIWQLLFFIVAVAAVIIVWKVISAIRRRSRKKHRQLARDEETQIPKQATRPTVTASDKTIFVSYRRDDSADVTGRIYDRLSTHFGAGRVFKDVDSIPLGRDFREVINKAVAKASVVVVVVGRNWLGREEGSAHARIQDQTDFVRTEVAAALQQDKPVIPVLVANATMPSESELPDDIAPFAYRNGVKVRPDPDFVHDMERLIRGIEQA